MVWSWGPLYPKLVLAFQSTLPSRGVTMYYEITYDGDKKSQSTLPSRGVTTDIEQRGTH